MLFSDSLKKNRDFQKVYKKGISYANKYLIMYRLENRTEENRVGICVSKKVGNSVVRHRLTRLIRESYRLNESSFQAGYDFVVIARNDSKKCSFYEIEKALLYLAKIHKIIKEKN